MARAWLNVARAGLADYALRLRTAEPGEIKSNVGGWHSAGNIFEREEPLIGVLAQHLQAAMQHVSSVAKQVTARGSNFKATLDGWINVNGAGDYNTPHYHPGNTWSGVYYIRTGSDVPNRPTSGRIEFLDPRTRCEFFGPSEGLRHSGSIWISPVDGMLLIFPSYLEHHVHPVSGLRRAHHPCLQQPGPGADAAAVVRLGAASCRAPSLQQADARRAECARSQTESLPAPDATPRGPI